MRTQLIPLAWLIGLAGPAFAGPAHAEEAGGATPVDEAVVTVARLPATPADAPGLRVVTRDEIDSIQAGFASDILTTVPGVSLYSEGAFGGLTSVRMRGASTDKTLVLIDGVPMNDPATPSGAYDFASLDLAQVERIEILSGPQSSLWGSAAIGGVISFTTREPDDISAGVEAGSFATSHAWVSVGSAGPDRAVSAYLSAFNTNGVSQADEADGAREADGFATWTAGAAGRLRLAEQAEVDVRMRYTDADVDTDGFPPPDYELADTADRAQTRTWSGGARARIAGPLGIEQTLSLSAYDIARESFGAFPGRFTGERQVWRWTGAHDQAAERWGLVGGVEYERVRGDASFADATLETASAFVVGRLDLGRGLRLTAGVRHDAPEDFAGRTTARLAVSLRLDDGWRASASWGQGFKTPTVSQILCDFCYAPPAPLRPETARGWDATLGWKDPGGRVQGSLTVFGLTVEDQIAYVGGRYQNIASTSARGLEADLEADLGAGFRVKAGYAYTDAVDDQTGRALLRSPLHSGSASLFWRQTDFDAALTLRAESEQSDVVGFSVGVRPGFAVLDLAGGWAVNPRVRLTVRVENLTDAIWQEAAGYGEPRRSGWIGLRLRY
ncbi:MAG: TonB-dependent receptor [Caulobacteraceae bacterium]|nr:TonB-dependent receptor [Caulobacteraceae bacterium]